MQPVNNLLAIEVLNNFTEIQIWMLIHLELMYIKETV